MRALNQCLMWLTPDVMIDWHYIRLRLDACNISSIIASFVFKYALGSKSSFLLCSLILDKFLRADAAVPAQLPQEPAENVSYWRSSQGKVRGYSSPALGVSPSSRNGATWTCTSKITGTNLHCSMSADQALEGERGYSSGSQTF